MRKIARHLIFVGIAVLFIGTFGSQFVDASPNRQSDGDLVARGEYLVKIASCEGCHTAELEAFTDDENLTVEQRQTAAFDSLSTLNQDLLLAGGRIFNLGPAGAFIGSNLTSDPETGLGEWTDEEIITAITDGISRDGRSLHPLMPYTRYSKLAEDDLNAIVAYLRTLPPIENEIPTPESSAPPAIPTSDDRPENAPDSSNLEARGEYLMSTVLNCERCHTFEDRSGEEPVQGSFLGGGNSFEDEAWGIVYSANLTPHETGLADWTDDEIKRALVSGESRDGRQLILMPWQIYVNLTTSDLEAVVSYLRNSVEPANNQVPENAVTEDFVVYRDGRPADSNDSSDFPVGYIVIAVGIVLLTGAVLMMRMDKNKRSATAAE